ncbi:neuropeptide S receptor-like [Symsagittifera roscoffensis]|uniref:neuropeptide S receptor-like n=1 Tax=Symsagittifera roscoffensis TaxID=84072 RepID=UPI00307BED44
MTNDSNSNGWSFFAGIYDTTYIYWPLTLLGSYGSLNNLFVITILWSQQNAPQLTILKSLAFSDLSINLTFLALINFPSDYKVPVNFFGNLACSTFFSIFLIFALSAVSAWHLVWLTLDLYGGQGEFKWHKYFFVSKLRIRLSIVALWVLGFLTMNNDLWEYYVDSETQTCFFSWRSDKLRYIVGVEVLVLILVLPLGIMTWCYLGLFKTMHDAKKYYELRNNTITSVESDDAYKTTKKFLISMSVRTSVLLLVYLVTWTPAIIWLTNVFKITNDGIFDAWFNNLAELIPILNAAMNPILYGWSWFEFRDAVKLKFTNMCCRKTRSRKTRSENLDLDN